MIIAGQPAGHVRQPSNRARQPRRGRRGNVDHVLRHQGTAQGLVHRLGRVRHRHRAERVAVITVGEAEESVFPGFSHVLPVLQRHLERHLDSDRTRIRKEDPAQPRGHQSRQSTGQPQRRLVHHAAEHDVRHRVQLPRHALKNMRVIVAVADAPPRRDTIDQFAAVGQDDAAAVCPHRNQRGWGELHLAVGQPDMRKTLFIPVGSCISRVE